MVQGIVNTLLALLRFGSYGYNIVIDNIFSRSADERAPIYFVITVGTALYLFGFATPFYVSMMTSKFFRNAFYEKINLIKRHFIG